jgi:hypothetical protein
MSACGIGEWIWVGRVYSPVYAVVLDAMPIYGRGIYFLAGKKTESKVALYDETWHPHKLIYNRRRYVYAINHQAAISGKHKPNRTSELGLELLLARERLAETGSDIVRLYDEVHGRVEVITTVAYRKLQMRSFSGTFYIVALTDDSRIVILRSTDAGDTWTAPIQVAKDAHEDHYPALVVTPDGKCHVAYVAGDGKIMIATSDNFLHWESKALQLPEE